VAVPAVAGTNELMFPVPDAARPMPVLVFVQLYDEDGFEPLNTID
jgi:hypothetical protein